MYIGFIITCFNEKLAVEFCLKSIKTQYPDAPVNIISDGGLDFSYLSLIYKNVFSSLEEDTMSGTFKVTDKNFKENDKQDIIKKSALATINRIKKSIDLLGTEYILMCDPDVFIRGKVNIPNGVSLLGSRVNFPLPDGYTNVFTKIPGAVPIRHWGATPAIFNSQDFLRAVKLFDNNLLDTFCKEFYAVYAHDVLLPTIFALIGIEETFNPDIIECKRSPEWRYTNNPIVHQFKEYY